MFDNASEGFTGWDYETLTFTPTSTSELLSFLAIGTPTGEPPTVLLSDVGMADTTIAPICSRAMALEIVSHNAPELTSMSKI